MTHNNSYVDNALHIIFNEYMQRDEKHTIDEIIDIDAQRVETIINATTCTRCYAIALQRVIDIASIVFDDSLTHETRDKLIVTMRDELMQMYDENYECENDDCDCRNR